MPEILISTLHPIRQRSAGPYLCSVSYGTRDVGQYATVCYRVRYYAVLLCRDFLPCMCHSNPYCMCLYPGTRPVRGYYQQLRLALK